MNTEEIARLWGIAKGKTSEFTHWYTHAVLVCLILFFLFLTSFLATSRGLASRRTDRRGTYCEFCRLNVYTYKTQTEEQRLIRLQKKAEAESRITEHLVRCVRALVFCCAQFAILRVEKMHLLPHNRSRSTPRAAREYVCRQRQSAGAARGRTLTTCARCIGDRSRAGRSTKCPNRNRKRPTNDAIVESEVVPPHLYVRGF